LLRVCSSEVSFWQVTPTPLTLALQQQASAQKQVDSAQKQVDLALKQQEAIAAIAVAGVAPL